jgi:hypothetical protein
MGRSRIGMAVRFRLAVHCLEDKGLDGGGITG